MGPSSSFRLPILLNAVLLVLDLAGSPERDPIVFMNYAVVVFSIIVQGLTLENALKWDNRRTNSK